MYVFDEMEECLMLYSIKHAKIEFLKSYVAKYMYVSRNSTQTRDPSVDGNRRLQAACSHLLMSL